jgi:hypothetical protein
MESFQTFMEAASEAIYTDEIVEEASGLIATIAEGLPLNTIITELHEYSKALSSMVLAKILHALYDSNTIEEMVISYRDMIAEKMVSDIDEFLQKESK